MGDRFCVRLSPPLMLSQCFFSLFRARSPAPDPAALAHPKLGGQQKEDRPSSPYPPAAGHQPHPCLVCFFIDSCCPATGASVFRVRGAA